MSKAHDSHACTCPSGDGSLRWPCPVHPALLPCPFCGASAAVQNESPADNSGGYFVACKSCGASTNLRYACGDDPVPLLVEQWNARVPLKTSEGAYPALPKPAYPAQFNGHGGEQSSNDGYSAEQLRAYAVQAVVAQTPAAPDAKRLRSEVLEHASKGSRLVRTLFNEPTGTLSDVEVGDWIQRAQQYLGLTQAAPAAPATLPDADRDDMTRMLDAAMVATANISPALRRSDCQRVISAALAVIPQASQAQPAHVQAEPVAWPHKEIGMVAIEWGRQKRLFPVLFKDGWMDKAIAELTAAYKATATQSARKENT